MGCDKLKITCELQSMAPNTWSTVIWNSDHASCHASLRFHFLLNTWMKMLTMEPGNWATEPMVGSSTVSTLQWMKRRRIKIPTRQKCLRVPDYTVYQSQCIWFVVTFPKTNKEKDIRNSSHSHQMLSPDLIEMYCNHVADHLRHTQLTPATPLLSPPPSPTASTLAGSCSKFTS